MESFFLVSEVVLCTLCLLLGIIFFVVPVPKNEHLKNYRISLKVLGVDYIILGLLDIPMLIFWEESHFFGYFSFIRVLLSSLQAFLLTFALLNLLNPQFITLQRLYKNVSPLVVFVVLYFASFLMFGNYELNSLSEFGEGLKHPTMVIRLLFFVFYAIQICYYCNLFHVEAKLFKKELENYFSDTHKLNQRTYLNLLRGAILVGIIALVSLIQQNLIFESFFTVVTIVFYFLFAVKFINYTKIFILIEPAIMHQPQNGQVELDGVKENPEPDSMRASYNYNWKNYRKRIVDEKHFLKEQVTLEDIAHELQVSRTTLSNLINKEEGQNFYSWINSLRIEYSKALITKNPGYTINQIALEAGFSETSNFSRTFKNITGITPSEWRKSNS
ncbi:MAG: helix-turn-helix domain-containing protein [Bacteroidales bacterium]